jgi:electron transfer flavoprotein beta subunit
MQAIDGDTAQTGPGITVHAEYALATYVSKIDEIDLKRARVHRLLEEGYEVCEVQMPAVFTVVKEINEPRTPSLRGKMKAKNAKIEVWTAESLGLDPDKCGLKGSPTQVMKIFSPEHRAGGEKWEGDVSDLATKMLDILRERVTI